MRRTRISAPLAAQANRQHEATATEPLGKESCQKAKMENKALSWVMAARKFGIANADEIFPEDDEPGRKRPAKKLVRTLAPKTGRCP